LAIQPHCDLAFGMLRGAGAGRTRRRRRGGEAGGASRREGARHRRLRAGMRGRTKVRETVRSGVVPIGERTSAARVESRSAAGASVNGKRRGVKQVVDVAAQTAQVYTVCAHFPGLSSLRLPVRLRDTYTTRRIQFFLARRAQVFVCFLRARNVGCTAENRRACPSVLRDRRGEDGARSVHCHRRTKASS
jgi:hypothetical protein